MDFAEVLRLFAINISQFHNSWSDTVENVNKSILNVGGRSGALFLLSNDKLYVLKTIPQSDLDALLKFMPNFVAHFQKFKHSRIVPILGSFSIYGKGTV